MSESDFRNQVPGSVEGVLVQARNISGGIHAHLARNTIVPRQLPADIPRFVGRGRDLLSLDEGLGRNAITVISGTPGVGKSALVVHWGNRHSEHFPDGQLYVNLRGFGPADAPVKSAVAVRQFLDAFGVSPAMVPGSPDGQAAMYRSLVDGKRVLIVLDNARDSDQVRPLLPGSPTCHVLVTSRRRLPSLVAVERAAHVTLDLFSAEESQELLATFLGEEKVHADDSAVGGLVERCARLPLALTIVAARATTNPYVKLEDLAVEIDELFTGDSEWTDVRAVFSWSYRALSAAVARLFRLIGLYPGTEINLGATASLAGMSVSGARRLVAELTAAHLVQEDVGERYRIHDLLHEYAAQQAATESPDHRRAALHRLLDYYLHTGFAADRLINPDRKPIELGVPRSGVGATEIADERQAWGWFTVEHVTMLAVVDLAREYGFERHAWQLPWVMATFLDRQGHWHECAEMHEVALGAVTRLGDRSGMARIQRFLGWAYTRLGRYDAALTNLQSSLSLCEDLGDVSGQATAYHGLSLLDQWRDNNTEAMDQARHALRLYREGGDVTGEATALNTLGWNRALRGEYHEAMVDAQHALSLFERLDDRFGIAEALYTLGYAHHRLSEFDEAFSSYRECLDIRRRVGDHYLAASTLVALGEISRVRGEIDSARDFWRHALAVFERLKHPDAERTRGKLMELSE